MNGIVADAACLSDIAADIAADFRPPRRAAFPLLNRQSAAAPQPDNSASFATVTRSTPTPIIRVPFTHA
ncbi:MULTISPECIES: hypothetical protein [Burkholderia]|uniref:hypothetical protein n=1 Tax=Burkholderia TaxID=32008 RepID=UPI00158342E0|nr:MULTISPECIES: hypothetical protein [Burkholderia]MBN3773582.1 hypothetical protein [Burkholderia sp. Se-20378]